MWQATHAPAGAVGVVVRVRSERVVPRELGVAPGAHRVPRGGRERRVLRAAVAGVVRIVAGRARERAGAAAEEEVARLARVDRASAAVGALAAPPFPRPRVAREEHLVASRADAIDRLGVPVGVALRFGPSHLQKGRVRDEARHDRRVREVSRGAPVARLAADADLDEIARPEALPRRRDRARHERFGCLPVVRTLSTEVLDFLRSRLRKALRIAHAPGPAPLGREKRVDVLPLVTGLRSAAQRAEDGREERLGVVAEDARLAPHRARARRRALVDEDRVALVAKRAGRVGGTGPGGEEELRDRQHQLVAHPLRVVVRARHLHPREVFTRPAADDARDAIELRGPRPVRDPHEPLPPLRLERDRVPFEMHRPPVERRADVGRVGVAGHAVHRRARPGEGLLRVARGAGGGAGVVAAQDVALRWGVREAGGDGGGGGAAREGTARGERRGCQGEGEEPGGAHRVSKRSGAEIRVRWRDDGSRSLRSPARSPRASRCSARSPPTTETRSSPGSS